MSNPYREGKCFCGTDFRFMASCLTCKRQKAKIRKEAEQAYKANIERINRMTDREMNDAALSQSVNRPIVCP